jgi:hypothetical protein
MPDPPICFGQNTAQAESYSPSLPKSGFDVSRLDVLQSQLGSV